MPALPHLRLKEKLSGIPRLSGRGGASEETKENQKNRKGHSEKLNSAVRQVRDEWSRHISERKDLGLAPLEDSVEPVFLQLDPGLVKAIDFDLEKFGVEVISEENDGFIIGASLDDLKSLEEKINEFAENEWGSGKIANFWQIIDGDRDAWRPKHILSEELYQGWGEIKDDRLYRVEVSIAFAKPIGSRPDRTKRGGDKRVERSGSLNL